MGVFSERNELDQQWQLKSQELHAEVILVA